MRRSPAQLSVAVVLGLLCLLDTPPAARAETGDPLELPGDTLSAVTVDLDGDLAPELLRLVESERGTPTLEAWSAPDGSWRLVDALAIGPTMAAEDRQPALLAHRREGATVVALLQPRTVRTTTVEPCCLGLSEVRLEGGTLVTRSQPMPLTSSIDRVQVVDLEADGTDELLLAEFVGTDQLLDPSHAVHLLRLDGDEWTSAWQSAAPVVSLGMAAGDVDGEPGDELYLGPDHDGRLLRLTARDGRIVEEITTVPLRAEPWAEVVGALDGSVLFRAPDDLVALAWPSGAEGRVGSRARPRGLGGVAIVGSGADARVVTSRGYQTPSQGAIALYDARLQAAGRFGESPAAGLIWDLVLAHAAPLFNLDRSIFPYIGPIPVGLDEPPGFLANGALARAGSGGVEVDRASPLLGYAPVGLAGPDGAWMILRDDPSAPDVGARLVRRASNPSDRLLIVPSGDVLRPIEPELGPMLRFDAAVREPTHEARAEVRSAADGFGVDVTAPPGSLVAVVGQRFDSHVVGADPWTLRVEPPPRLTEARGDPGEGDRPFRRWVLVVLPNGTAVAERWDGVFVVEPPLIEVAAAATAGGERAEITGRTRTGNQVRIDGAEVSVDGEGSFATTAPIELLPRTLAVEVVDPFGSVTRSSVTVPGVVDPAGLPWIPIAGGLTLLAALAMFLRMPAARERPAPIDEGDGRLEEIDAD